MKRYIVTLLTLALLPGTALAQQDPHARIAAAKSRVEQAGIPVSLLDSRVAEGRAKGVPMERIAAAVERRATALSRAQQAMRGARGLSEADLAAGADAVEAGLGEDPIRAVAEVARAEDRPVAIAVLTYLSQQQGVPLNQALEQVTRALQQGPDALRQLPTQAAGQARRGRPDGVGGGRPDGVGRGGPPSGVPAPGKRPGAGRPAGVGKPDGVGKPGGPPGGKPGGG